MTEAPIRDDGRDPLDVALDDLIAANRILAREGVVDAFGHISCRHPLRSDHFLMSRARAPGLVERADIIEFDADGTPLDANGRHPYVERFIHAAIYEARPDVRSVVHDHSHKLVPFGACKTPLRPLGHTGGIIGDGVPVWDVDENFGSCSNLLVVNMTMGRDLARRLGAGTSVLMRGHGAVAAGPSIRVATIAAIALEVQAQLQMQAMALGDPKFLSSGEVAASALIFDEQTPGDAVGRTWEYWCMRADVPFHRRGA